MTSSTSRTDHGVSPVVAVILLVAVTVTLSAVIGGFALNLGQSTTEGQPQSKVGVSTSQSNGTFTATVVTGSADTAKLLVNGTAVDNSTNPSPGDTLSASVSSGASVTIVTVTDGERTVVASETDVTQANTDSSTTTLEPAVLLDDDFSTNTTDEYSYKNPGRVSYDASKESLYIDGADNTQVSILRGDIPYPSTGHIQLNITVVSDYPYGNSLFVGFFNNSSNSDAVVRGDVRNPSYTDRIYGVQSDGTKSIYADNSGSVDSDGTKHTVDLYWNDTTVKLYLDGSLHLSETNSSAELGSLALNLFKIRTAQADMYVHSVFVERVDSIP